MIPISHDLAHICKVVQNGAVSLHGCTGWSTPFFFYIVSLTQKECDINQALPVFRKLLLLSKAYFLFAFKSLLIYNHPASLAKIVCLFVLEFNVQVNIFMLRWSYCFLGINQYCGEL